MPVKNYRDLECWREAMDLVQLIYEVTGDFPKTEQYGLTSQIRRAAVSIPANIAEGQGRKSDREFHQFLSISHGSLREVETLVEISKRVGFLTEEVSTKLSDQLGVVGRLVSGLSRALK